MAWAGSRFALIAVVMCIEGVLSMRNLDRQSFAPLRSLNATLGFFDRRFQQLVDLGYMSWYMNCTGVSRPRASAGDVEVEEVRCGLGADSEWRLPEAKLVKLKELDRIRETLPRKLPFNRLEEGVGYHARPPHALPAIAGPFVASKRFDLSKIDFILGGSLLDTLATGDFNGKDYTVQRWRGTVMIRGFSRQPQFINLKSTGFQFERLVTSRRMDEMASSETNLQHLQVLRIGDYNVLVIGKVDAVDATGRLTEITTVFTPDWRRIMFTMLAKGSTSLVRGIVEEHWPNEWLNEIGEYSLRDLISWTVTQEERRTLAVNILRSLRLIRKRVLQSPSRGLVLFRMNETKFLVSPRAIWTHNPKLYPIDASEATGRSLLPAESVLQELFPGQSEDVRVAPS